MDCQMLLILMMIGFISLNRKCVTMAQDSEQQDAEDLEELFRRTFSNESIALMAEQEEIIRNSASTASAAESISPEDIARFQLFTQSNPEDAYPLELDNRENLEGSAFSSGQKTKVIIHGWQATVADSWVKDMTANYLAVGDYNIITVDWSILSMESYLPAEQSTRSVGDRTAQLLNYLQEAANLSFDDVHLVGHSLGAHVAGFAGARVNGAIDRITGMDPAGPLFEIPELKPSNERLDYTDAEFVDIIHTCAGIVGFYMAIGDVDFYPNGGTCDQPGCDLSLTCSHGRSHDYMVESIMNPDEFYAEQCSSFLDYDNGLCQGAGSATMGESVDVDSNGVFYLSTNSEPPYGRGESGSPTNGADYVECLITLTILSTIISNVYAVYSSRV